MTIKEKIKEKLVVFYMAGNQQVAFELGALYLYLAATNAAQKQAVGAYFEGMYWLRIAGQSTCDPSSGIIHETAKKILAGG